MELSTTTYTSLKERGLKRSDIAKEFGITEDQLKRLITKNGWGIKRPIIGNTEFFDSYSQESCYWGGFMASDGNVDSKKRVRIMLNYDDTSHLEKFKTALKSTHTISSNTDTYYRSSFEFTNSHICDALISNFNVVPNKSKILEFPIQIPFDMLKHYIRGYFDGDGSICEAFSNKNSTTATLYATFCSGSEEFIYDLFEFLKIELALGGSVERFKDSVKFQIKYNTNDAKTLLTWMYKDSTVYLDRKYQLYDRIVAQNIRKTR